MINETTKSALQTTSQAGQSPLGGDNILALLLSLLVVLAVIFILAALMKRMNIKMQGHGSNMRVISNTALGPKERLLVVQVGESKLLLGVTAQSIQLLKELPDDFAVGTSAPGSSQGSLFGSFSQHLKQQIRRRNE
ncbi:MAG: flagellar biosynthetic protein FliO [Idiomarina sp.]